MSPVLQAITEAQTRENGNGMQSRRRGTRLCGLYRRTELKEASLSSSAGKRSEMRERPRGGLMLRHGRERTRCQEAKLRDWPRGAVAHGDDRAAAERRRRVEGSFCAAPARGRKKQLTSWTHVVSGSAKRCVAKRFSQVKLMRCGPGRIHLVHTIENGRLGLSGRSDWSDRPNPLEPSDQDQTACMHWCI